jgi:hypothetical protein
MSELKKAIIQVLGKNPRDVPVLFYPHEYTMDKENEFATIGIPGLDSPFIQFTRGGPETLSMELFFDSYEAKEDVRIYTNEICDLMKIDPDLHAPPVLKIIWGSINFTCVLKKVSKKFTMFRPDGVPVRATLNTTFQEFRTESRSKERPKQSSDKTRVYTIKEGDSLWAIAAMTYGDPAKWRFIAQENQIENPRLIAAGKEITVPPLEK